MFTNTIARTPRLVAASWCLGAFWIYSAMVPVLYGQSVWVGRNSGTTKVLSGVAYGGGVFVAVGENGVILTSPDGDTWVSRTSGTTNPLRGITFGNGTFVATGAGGTALTSPDGIAWTSRNARTSTFLSGVAFGDGRFVAVGGSGTVRYSADGVSWSLGSSPTTNFLQSVSFGGGKYVAVGSGTIMSSTDGQSWSLAASGSRSGDYYTGTIHLESGSYIVTGRSATVHTSVDANNWVFQDALQMEGITDWLRFATSHGSQVVAVGENGRILSSPNGIDWTSQASGATTCLNAVCYGAGIFVAVGGAAGATMVGLILTSVDDSVPPPFTFDAWRQQVFTAEELEDPLISGPDADFDRNGIRNFVEYALGLPQGASETGGSLPQLSVVTGGDSLPHLALSFQRPADRVGVVTYSVLTSTDLATWTDLDEPEEIVSEGGGVQTVRIVDPAPIAGRKFYDLMASGG